MTTAFPDRVATVRRQCERLVEVGELLKDPALSLKQIGERVALSRERVRQLQAKYFPDTPKRPRGGDGKNNKHFRDDVLLDRSIPTADLAAQLGVSVPRVVQLRSDAIRRRGLLPPMTFKRAIHAALRESGYAYCWKCRCAKCFDEFPPKAQKTHSGNYLCTACNSDRQRQHYRDNPKHREYCRRYQREHADQQREASRRWRLKRATSRFDDRLFERIAARDFTVSEAVRSGETTLVEAAIKLGLRPKRIGHSSTVEGFMRAVRRYLTRDEREQLKAAL